MEAIQPEDVPLRVLRERLQAEQLVEASPHQQAHRQQGKAFKVRRTEGIWGSDQDREREAGSVFDEGKVARLCEGHVDGELITC